MSERGYVLQRIVGMVIASLMMIILRDSLHAMEKIMRMHGLQVDDEA